MQIRDISAIRGEIEALYKKGEHEFCSIFFEISIRISDRDILDFINVGKLPPVQLSKKELEMLRGGMLRAWVKQQVIPKVFERHQVKRAA